MGMDCKIEIAKAERIYVGAYVVAQGHTANPFLAKTKHHPFLRKALMKQMTSLWYHNTFVLKFKDSHNVGSTLHVTYLCWLHVVVMLFRLPEASVTPET